MTLEIHELVQLSRVSNSLQTSDPEFARRLSAPVGRRRRPLWKIASTAVLMACAPSSLLALATGSTAVLAVGGGVVMTGYPFLLVMANERTALVHRPGERPGPER